MSNPQAPGERSPAEPTMEEILASIRRIVADGKPGEREPEAPETDVAPPPPEPKSVASSPSPDRSNAETERPAATPDAADPETDGEAVGVAVEAVPAREPVPVPVHRIARDHGEDRRAHQKAELLRSSLRLLHATSLTGRDADGARAGTPILTAA